MKADVFSVPAPDDLKRSREILNRLLADWDVSVAVVALKIELGIYPALNHPRNLGILKMLRQVHIDVPERSDRRHQVVAMLRLEVDPEYVAVGPDHVFGDESDRAFEEDLEAVNA